MKKINASNSRGNIGLLGAGIAAFFASICCVGPLVLLSLGISGAWIGNLSALETYRPLFMAITLAFLGFAFYQVYQKPGAMLIDGDEDCGCPTNKRRSKFMLWGATVFIAALFAFPYLSPVVLADNPDNGEMRLERAVLDIDNMTCSACTVTVNRSLTRIDGVKEAKVTLKPPVAVVFFDPSKVSKQVLVTATTNAGYPSSVRKK